MPYCIALLEVFRWVLLPPSWLGIYRVHLWVFMPPIHGASYICRARM